MTEPRTLAARAGEEHGRQDAVLFLFAGEVDNDAILALHEKLKHGDQEAFESLPKPQEGTLYAPNLIAVSDTALRGIESPYSWYMELCDAYDTAYNEAVLNHINTVAAAISEGIM